LFQGRRLRVDVELTGEFTQGCTSVDLYNYREAELTDWKEDPESKKSWGKKGKNVFVLEKLDVRFFPFLLFSRQHAEPPLTGSRFLVTLPGSCRLCRKSVEAEQVDLSTKATLPAVCAKTEASA
jgi:hypothetical protein